MTTQNCGVRVKFLLSNNRDDDAMMKSLRTVFTLLWLFAPMAQGLDESEAGSSGDLVWLDRAHQSATTSVDNMALWIDGVFGDQVTEDEAMAESYLRVIGRYSWNENAENANNLRVRGTLYVPKVNDRLALLFDDDDIGDEALDTIPGAGSESPDLGIQWRLSKQDASSIDLTAHWRDSGIRPGIRFRRQTPVTDNVAMRFYHRFDYGKDGWETSTELIFDNKVTSGHLYRWRTRLDTSLGDEAASWRTVFQSRHAKGEGAALHARQWFLGVAGKGSSAWRDTAKYVGVTWRRSYVRDYLWFEVEPRYTWQSALCDCDTASLQLRVEVLLFDPD